MSGVYPTRKAGNVNVSKIITISKIYGLSIKYTNQLEYTELEPLTHIGRVDARRALNLLKKHYRMGAIIVKHIEYEKVKYTMPLEEFLKTAKRLERGK